ncbi:hypothetical protein FTUN_5780 [Frigoriglobus tundricola]|uniref:Uncharacterized protein n=1 Tax=Frigoriglobus tundricola TaxID=2774151 RepID=A0A6M5YW78_9BACT|nr:hypothetical protein FTUN_5780 [Frigoriglobus tundricola]
MKCRMRAQGLSGLGQAGVVDVSLQVVGEVCAGLQFGLSGTGRTQPRDPRAVVLAPGSDRYP